MRSITLLRGVCAVELMFFTTAVTAPSVMTTLTSVMRVWFAASWDTTVEPAGHTPVGLGAEEGP